MIELLQSVAEGFPIGSVLLWGVDRKMLNIAPTEETSFPSVEERYPTSYVLDGMQRLSTLYGVFHFGVSTCDSRFDVFYDLDSGLFMTRNKGEQPPDTAVPLSAIFTPRQLLEHQARLTSLMGADALIEKLLLLQAAFQEYMIPVVTIRSGDVHRIVGIFERINSTGTKLDPVDFMRAITWAEDFDLNHYLEMAASELSETGMELSAETIIKCVGLTLGVPPTTDGLLELRNQRTQQLTKAFRDTIPCMRRVSNFLKDNFEIWSSSFVPYEGQLLLLFKTIGMQESAADYNDLIVHWYWATGFNESLRGKPDHYVVRALENWRGLVRGDIRGLEPRLKLTAIEFFERRLVSGGALSATFAAMHAVNRAQSLVDGGMIEPATYMTSSDLSQFEPVFSREEMLSGGLPHTISAKIFANVILIDRAQLKRRDKSIQKCILNAAASGAVDALRSQFIDEATIAALQAGKVRDFMLLRAHLMHEKAEALVTGTNV
jgi:hypothetical protein